MVLFRERKDYGQGHLGDPKWDHSYLKVYHLGSTKRLLKMKSDEVEGPRFQLYLGY